MNTPKTDIGTIIYATYIHRTHGDLLTDFYGSNAGILSECRGYDAAIRGIDSAVIDRLRNICRGRNVLIIDTLIDGDGKGNANKLANYARYNNDDFYILGLRDISDPHCPSLDTAIFDVIIDSRNIRDARNHLSDRFPGLFPPTPFGDCRYDD